MHVAFDAVKIITSFNFIHSWLCHIKRHCLTGYPVFNYAFSVDGVSVEERDVVKPLFELARYRFGVSIPKVTRV